MLHARVCCSVCELGPCLVQFVLNEFLEAISYTMEASRMIHRQTVLDLLKVPINSSHVL